MFAEAADQPLEGTAARRPSGTRRLSYSSQASAGLRISNSTGSYSRAGGRLLSLRGHIGSDTDRAEIHSPTPKRHFLLQTESSDLLNSRPDTPFSTISTSSHVDSFSSSSPQRPLLRQQTLSFSSLHANETKQSSPSKAERPATRLRLPSASYVREANESSLGRRWVKWMHRNRLDNHILLCMVSVAVLIKWFVGLSGYSGEGTPPHFGDFEAQRHWMEISQHLPIKQWYTYDHAYWGLDYPPLTAYHSWLCGLMGSLINSRWFALESSRGIETPSVKVFMRATVLASDLLIYIPALILFVRTWLKGRSSRTQHLALFGLFLQPSLILIDSGHFQFNSIMLGLTVLALTFFAQGKDELGAICFVGSLCFKQMALYYAPAVGSYLLANCVNLGFSNGSQLFVRLGITTVVSFMLVFLPWLPPFSPFSGIFDPITRIFPFQRGLFEDKVANFWCATNVFVKWRVWLSQPSLIKASIIATALGFIPSVGCFLVVAWKSMSTGAKVRDRTESLHNESALLPILPWAMLSSSMSFFLFSFQVHEKTILLPLLPLNLLLTNARRNSFAFEWGMLVNNVAVFSLYPLLKRDGEHYGLSIAYFVVTLLWNRLQGYSPFGISSSRWLFVVSISTFALICTIHVAELIIVPPERYPDIFAVLNVLLSAPFFGLTLLWSIKRSVEVGISVLF